MICANDELARADLVYVIVNSALKETLDDRGKQLLREEASAFGQRVTTFCGVPDVGHPR
jgi:hypothetical protein